MTKLALDTSTKNAAVLKVGGLTVFFSYDMPVGFRHDMGAEVNPAARGFSPTTAKHITQCGLRDAKDSASEADFHAALTNFIGFYGRGAPRQRVRGPVMQSPGDGRRG